MFTEMVLGTGGLTAGIATWGAWRAMRREAVAQALCDEAAARGSNRPVSLHPVVDSEICIGSGACVNACPEHVLELAAGRPQIVEAGSCVGHGHCRTACPLGAIRLVMGTAARGVDLPLLDPDYATNVPGIYIAGELGGMGLIRNAFRQGVLAAESVARALREQGGVRDRRRVDVAIVGAGPAGLATALRAQQLGLTYVVLEQYKLGGSLIHYPRHKLVLSEAVDLPLVGRFGRDEMSKEQLVDAFARVVRRTGLQIQEHERVLGIDGAAGAFRIRAVGPQGEHVVGARSVVLAIGRRGTPRKLGVPGEDAPHVTYRLVDAAQYRGQSVLGVGGGDSAVEAALALADTARTTVHLSYRRRDFARIKRKNREKLDAALEQAKIRLHLRSEVSVIRHDAVRLTTPAGPKRLRIDAVIVNVGGELPDGFLRSMGIDVVTRTGETIEPPSSESSRISKRIAAVTASTVRASASSSRRLTTWLSGSQALRTRRGGRGR